MLKLVGNWINKLDQPITLQYDISHENMFSKKNIGKKDK